MNLPAAATAAGANMGGGASGPLRPWRALNRAYHGRRRLSVGSLLGLPLSWMLESIPELASKVVLTDSASSVSLGKAPAPLPLRLHLFHQLLLL